MTALEIAMINDRLLAHNSREEAIFRMKKVIIFTLCVSAALLLCGCTTNADPMPGNVSTSPKASPMTSASPSATTLPEAAKDMLTDTVNKIMGTDDALKASQQIRDAVSKLTEVDTAVCAAAGDSAAIGVTYNSSYQGKMDDRLRGMIYARVKALHPGITTIYVTDDAAKNNEIASLYQMLQSGGAYETVESSLKSLTADMEAYKE